MVESQSPTSKMRALFSAMEWFPDCKVGGLDRYFYEQLQALAGRGINGTAMVSSCEQTSLHNVSIRPMAGKRASLPQRWRGARKIAREAFQGGVDVVNSHFALYAFPWVREIPRGIPLIVNFQGPWAEEMRTQSPGLKRRAVAAVAKQIERSVYRRADRVITLSEAFRQLLHQQYGVPLSRIHVVPGASHLEPYYAAPERRIARERLGWLQDRKILLSVRRLAKRMGLDLLIEAIAAVRNEFPEVLLLIGGKGPERENLQKKIVELGLENNVQLLGFIAEEDLPLVYAAADLSIVPTVALEGFGLITVESLASGTPVLGTPVSATPEILLPLQPELVFEAPTVEAMADRIRAVFRGTVSLPTRERCREYVKRYGWTEVVPRILDVYQQAMDECRKK